MKTLAYLLGAGLVVLAISNWKTCTSAHYLTDQNGNRLPDGAACPSPGTCKIITTTRTPNIGCLFNPFPGGL